MINSEQNKREKAQVTNNTNEGYCITNNPTDLEKI